MKYVYIFSSKGQINLHINNRPRQDYYFKPCLTEIIATQKEDFVTYTVNCSAIRNDFKLPSRKEDQTFDCFNVSVSCKKCLEIVVITSLKNSKIK